MACLGLSGIGAVLEEGKKEKRVKREGRTKCVTVLFKQNMLSRDVQLKGIHSLDRFNEIYSFTYLI